jgi:hypothetical protein
MTPLQIKLAVALVAVITLIGTGIWFRGVVAERDELKKSKALSDATVKIYADVWNSNAALQKEIINAVKQIRVESNAYIDTVEAAAPPVVPAGGSIAFIAPGVPVPAAAGLSRFAGYTAGRTGPAAPPR